MLLTRKKKQQNKRLFSKLHVFDADFLIGHNNREVQAENWTKLLARIVSSRNMNGAIQGNSPQMDLQTLEENVVNKVRSQVNGVIRAVESRVQDGVMIAIENIVIRRVELALKSANVPSWRSVDGSVMDPYQKDFLAVIEGLQTTDSSRKILIKTWIETMRLMVVILLTEVICWSTKEMVTD